MQTAPQKLRAMCQWASTWEAFIVPQVGLASGSRVRGQGSVCCLSLNLAGREWAQELGLSSRISTDVVYQRSSFDIPVSNHLLLQLSFLLTLHPSPCPEDEAPVGRSVCTRIIHIHWGRVRNPERFSFVLHLVVLPLSASLHLLSFLICALSPSSLCAFVHNSCPCSLSQLFCLFL